MIFYLIYFLFSPLIWILLQISRLFSYKINQRFKLINHTIKNCIKIINENKNDKKIIILHSASAGEFEQAKPLLKLINQKKYFIILSFFSPTAYELNHSKINHDAIIYHPYDFIWSAFYFFYKVKPDFYIITRHDIWPTHMIVSSLFKVKNYLINANYNTKSIRFSFVFKNFNKFIFKNFMGLLTGSDRLKLLLSNIFDNKKIFVTGDSRFDQIIERKKNTTEYLNTEIYKTQNIIFGSVLLSEIPLIISAIKSNYLNNDEIKFKKNRIIIVPHEINNNICSVIKTKFYNANLNIEITDLSTSIDLNEIILIKKVGILANLYKYANLAYVGGGFNRGVHSVIEPAIYKCYVACGPKIELLDEAVEMNNQGLLKIINNENDLAEFISTLNTKKNLKSLVEKMDSFIYERANATTKIINHILN